MGRAPSTTQAELSHTAIRLFIDKGFDNTTIDDIAQAAGIGRRTFFRYFSSKNDLPWGDFEDLLARMEAQLAAVPEEVPLMEGLRQAILDFNRVPEVEWGYHRQRMELLLNVPTLLAHSTLRYSSWRHVVAQHVARRLDVAEDTLVPQTIAWVCLGVCLAAYEQWLRDDSSELLPLLDQGLALVDARIGTDVAWPRGSTSA